LRKRGYHVTGAGSLGAAVESATTEEFDLLICDLRLPDGSGLDLMRRLNGRGGVKGIAMSGNGLEEDPRKSRDAGFSAHLIKPVDFSRLDATIQRVASELVPETQRLGT